MSRLLSLPAVNRRGFPEVRVILGLICLIFLGVTWVLSTMLGPMGGAVGAIQAGVGLRDAFLTALPLSFAVIILFALVAGDGLVGELGAMLLGFFVMLIFFTGSIALVL
jgi:hypothetical protein